MQKFSKLFDYVKEVMSKTMIKENNEIHEEKIIFLHIPKTAGTSLRKIIEQEYPGKDCVYIYSHSPEFFSSIQKALPKARAIYGHISYGIHDLLNIQGRYVTFLRDPVSRVISFYKHQAKVEGSEFYVKKRKGMTIKDIVNYFSILPENK